MTVKADSSTDTPTPPTAEENRMAQAITNATKAARDKEMKEAGFGVRQAIEHPVRTSAIVTGAVIVGVEGVKAGYRLAKNHWWGDKAGGELQAALSTGGRRKVKGMRRKR